MWHMQGTLGGIMIVVAGFLAIGLMATMLLIAYKRGTKGHAKPHNYRWPRPGKHHPA